MTQREVIGVVEAGKTVVARAVAMQPGETFAQAVARQDARAQRIAADRERKLAARLILNKSQAEAVYSAMCALNNVSARIKAQFGDVSTDGVNVFEEVDDTVTVVRVRHYDVLEAENYANQAAFATAYGLQQG